jgi:hypothetical protein
LKEPASRSRFSKQKIDVVKTLSVVLFVLMNLDLAAQDTSAVQLPILPPNSAQEINREKIQVSDLPYGVKESLKGADYVGWTVEGAYKARMTDPQSPESEGIEIYIVELKKNAYSTSIRFDKDGRELDDPDKERRH